MDNVSGQLVLSISRFLEKLYNIPRLSIILSWTVSGSPVIVLGISRN